MHWGLSTTSVLFFALNKVGFTCRDNKHRQAELRGDRMGWDILGCSGGTQEGGTHGLTQCWQQEPVRAPASSSFTAVRFNSSHNKHK